VTVAHDDRRPGPVTGAAASQPRPRLANEYAAGLRAYIAGAGEAALARAYELGRRAAGDGISLLDLAMIHHDALASALGGDDDRATAALAAQFLAECLSPFEMTLRAYQSSARLLGLGDSLARQNSELDRAREQLRTILDATTAMIYLKDAEGHYLFVNREFQKVFGVAREEAIGKLDGDLLPPAVADLLRRNDHEVLAGGAPREIEETIPAHDGAHTYIALKFPLLDATGVAYALCCVATDITERKHVAEELRRAKEATEDANRELESFSYSVAHDLRAPLRSIDGFSQALIEDCADRLDGNGLRHLQRVRDASQHMGELIDGLLVLSRVTTGELCWEPVDLSRLALSIAARLRPPAPDAQRQVELVVQPGMTVHGDARLLGIALDNLIGNAWKFTGKRAQARVEIGRMIQCGRPVWFVRDNGAGFDMASVGRLFGTFQRLHAASEFEGHGIGLATVQRIVQRHHGRIWAEGQADVGATFYFTVGEPPG
jgi:PAS domain S-box-containing protein